MNEPDPRRLRRAEEMGWHWVLSIDPEGRQCRTLHPCHGAAGHLQFANHELPIWQTHPLPEVE